MKLCATLNNSSSNTETKYPQCFSKICRFKTPFFTGISNTLKIINHVDFIINYKNVSVYVISTCAHCFVVLSIIGRTCVLCDSTGRLSLFLPGFRAFSDFFCWTSSCKHTPVMIFLGGGRCAPTARSFTQEERKNSIITMTPYLLN